MVVRERGRVTSHHRRLEHLRDALDATRIESSSANLYLVGLALEGLEFGNDDDSTDEEDHLELHCQELGCALARQLGPAAPAFLGRFMLSSGDVPANNNDR